jgi:hypothetical protein
LQKCKEHIQIPLDYKWRFLNSRTFLHSVAIVDDNFSGTLPGKEIYVLLDSTAYFFRKITVPLTSASNESFDNPEDMQA